MQTLDALIDGAMTEQGLSSRQVADRAVDRGFKITHSVVNAYRKGAIKRPTRDSLDAIAAGLGIPVERLLAAAKLPQLGKPFELPAEASLLTSDERMAILEVVHAFIKHHKHSEEVTGDDDPAPNKRAAGSAATDELHAKRVTRKYTPPWEDSEDEELDVAAERGHGPIEPDEDMPQ